MSSRERDPESQRRAQPLNEPLPATFQWLAKLPRDLRPLALFESFPRIANALAQSWNDQLAVETYLESLLVDRRGGRRGFPTNVHNELLALRDFIVSRNGGQQARIGALVKAIDDGESPANLSQLTLTHLSTRPTLTDDDFLALRLSLGKRMDEARFGTTEWDGYEAILEMLDDAHERSLRGNSERPIADREESANYLIDRILNQAATVDEQGRGIFEPSRVSRLVALAEEKGLLAKLGGKGDELRSLGDLGQIVAASPKAG